MAQQITKVKDRLVKDIPAPPPKAEEPVKKRPLPKKISTFLTHVAQDMRVLNKMPNVGFHMKRWVYTQRNRGEPADDAMCYVCCAGAYMYRSRGVGGWIRKKMADYGITRHSAEPLLEDPCTNAKIQALNGVRQGEYQPLLTAFDVHLSRSFDVQRDLNAVRHVRLSGLCTKSQVTAFCDYLEKDIAPIFRKHGL